LREEEKGEEMGASGEKKKANTGRIPLIPSLITVHA
jgi:hypothetical protein